MEFLEDDEPRPRFLVQSRNDGNHNTGSDDDADSLLKTSRVQASICILSSAALFLCAVLLPSLSQTLSFLLSWSSLSLLLAPFAPRHLTGGDIRVGVGPPLPDPEPDPAPAEDPKPRRRSRPVRTETPLATADFVPLSKPERGGSGAGGEEPAKEAEDRDWYEDDLEILKKQMMKHPVGTARRWELIAAAFGGRRGVKSVIAAAKTMAERRPAAEDSFKDFLKRRKPVDGRMESAAVDGDSFDAPEGEEREAAVKWTSGEDLAVLNALKAFPKDTAMRWEKIAAAVPGRSKACCMKRVAELKRDFRSSKATGA